MEGRLTDDQVEKLTVGDRISQVLLRQKGKMAGTIWEVRGLWHDAVSSTQYADRQKAYEAFDTMVRSDPAWLA